MLDFYANQKLEWKHVTGIDKYTQPTYSTATIKGRKEDGIKIVKNAQGVDTVSTAQVFTESIIIPGDLIDGRKVIATGNAVDLEGTTLFKRVYLQ